MSTNIQYPVTLFLRSPANVLPVTCTN